MIILKEKLDGYNNVLTLATENMKFCVNKHINYVEPRKDSPTVVPKETTTTAPKEITIPTILKRDNGITYSEENVYLLGSALTLGYIAARYII